MKHCRSLKNESLGLLFKRIAVLKRQGMGHHTFSLKSLIVRPLALRPRPHDTLRSLGSPWHSVWATCSIDERQGDLLDYGVNFSRVLNRSSIAFKAISTTLKTGPTFSPNGLWTFFVHLYGLAIRKERELVDKRSIHHNCQDG